jgi:chorismate mutase
MDSQIQAIYAQLTPDLEANDPIRFNTLGTRFSLLMNQRQNLAQHIGQQKQQLTQSMESARQQAMQERLTEALPKVKSAIKDFGPETAKQISDYAKNTGFSSEELEHISFSAPAVISLWKAQEYDRMQAAAKANKPKLQSLPPVAKPGARPAQNSEQSARMKETTQAWKKGGGKDASALASILRQRLGAK